MIDCEISYLMKLKDAVDVIEKKRKTITVIVDDDYLILGTISDGDIRRALLAGHNLESSVMEALNKKPVIAKNNKPLEYYKTIISENYLEAVPVVDDNHVYIKTIHLSDLHKGYEKDDASGFSIAVIMAGGEGKRLRPLTEKIPKPMIQIGDIPLIELQVKRLVNAGINRIYISVNYLSHVIEGYLGDGSGYGADIKYIREDRKLGTAGALSLLEEIPQGPTLLINGDVITNTKFGNLLNFHNTYESDITVASVEHNIQIPYGVIRSNGPKIVAIEEKPSQKFLCNAGIYSLSPSAIQSIPHNTYFDITELIDNYIENDKIVNVFPIHEYWADIGSLSDLKRVQGEINIEEFAYV